MPEYGTIVADPPWEYRDGGPLGADQPGGFVDGRREAPYPMMSVAEISALPVSALAAPDAALWLWTTSRYLPDAFSVMASWGFSYRQTLVWGKNNPMPVGSIAPSAAEFLLYGRCGKPKMRRAWPSSCLVLPRPSGRRHSTKPEAFLDYIEASSPGPYVELFARRNRMGWDTWGNECLPLAEMA